MKSIFKTAFLSLICVSMLFLSSSCATIFSDSNYLVRIDSNPPKVEFAILNKKGVEIFRGTTPNVVNLSAKARYFSAAQYTIRIYKDKEVIGSTTIYGKIDGWYFANLLVGGILGMVIIDPVSGAMWKLEESVFVQGNP